MKIRHSTQYVGTSLRKRVMRILLICAMAAAFLLFVLMLGNLLHDRLERAKPLLSLPAVSYSNIPETVTEMTRPAFKPHTAPSGMYYAPDPAVFTQTKTLKDSFSVAAELYDALSVTLYDENGARFHLLNTPAASNILSRNTFLALLKAAEAVNMPLCAVCQIPASIPEHDSDIGLILAAAAKAGCSEILFTTLNAASLTEREIASMTALTQTLKEISPRLLVGFALEYEVFTDAELSSVLEQMAMQMDFLAVDLGEIPPEEKDAASYARRRAEAISGSIVYYPLRILVRGSEVQSAAQINILRECGFSAVQAIR